MTRLAELSHLEAAEIVRAGAVALWPIGSTEAHGPHLPLDTDVRIAEESCRRSLPALEAKLGMKGLVLPPLAFTVTEFASPFKGTLTLPADTVLRYVRDAALAASRLGVRAVCLVNAHLEPRHRFTLRDAVAEANGAGAPCPIGIADPADSRWARTLTEEFASGSCHAGRYETSLLLASDAAHVRESVRRGLPANTIDLLGRIKAGARTFTDAGAPDCYSGDPAGASAAEGARSYERLAAIVVEVVSEMLGESAEERT